MRKVSALIKINRQVFEAREVYRCKGDREPNTEQLNACKLPPKLSIALTLGFHCQINVFF